MPILKIIYLSHVPSVVTLCHWKEKIATPTTADFSLVGSCMVSGMGFPFSSGVRNLKPKFLVPGFAGDFQRPLFSSDR